jgi:glycosyltransferase involved in cell wall biosynthesis
VTTKYADNLNSNRPKRILILMAQPPGGTGVQGLLYTKLLPFLKNSNWEFHFSGPDPSLTSVLCEPTLCPSSHCHYSKAVSASVRHSVNKNRFAKNRSGYYYYAALQLVSKIWERFTGHDSADYLRRDMIQTALKAEREWDFDLIAGKSPDFYILETAADVARQVGKPFLAIFDDPHGRRDDQQFYPLDREKQINLLKQAKGVIFMSRLTKERYITSDLVDACKTYSLSDSYPLPDSTTPDVARNNDRTRQSASHAPQDSRIHVVHLGNLPKWRPLNTFIDALNCLIGADKSVKFRISFYGYVYEGAKELIKKNPAIASRCDFHPAVSHQESHVIAERADLLFVMIGRRHRDNQPSKFFEYLGHHKPVLVVGPMGNPIQKIVEDLAIGIYADVDHPDSIETALSKLIDHYGQYVKAFEINKTGVEAYSAKNVAGRWAETLDLVDQQPLTCH